MHILYNKTINLSQNSYSLRTFAFWGGYSRTITHKNCDEFIISSLTVTVLHII